MQSGVFTTKQKVNETMRRALVVGIDAYPNAPLSGCVNDAVRVKQLLETHGDGSPNFSVRLLSSNNNPVTTTALDTAVGELFKGDAEMVLFFFAGHGLIREDYNAGYLIAQHGSKPGWGLSLVDLVNIANKSYPRIRSTVIILDSCHSGYAGEVSSLGSDHGISLIGSGVTILTACEREGLASECGGQGVFTEMLIDALNGSAADVRGNVTAASVYSHVDQVLGPWGQRPVYKANVQNFVVLRKIQHKIPLETLRQLPEFFPDSTSEFHLNPSFEPDRGMLTEELSSIPVIEENVRVYRQLQACNRHGLVVPIDHEHMWHAAVHSTGCRLTALGAHYRRLAVAQRI
jgi:hypothetical protein